VRHAFFEDVLPDDLQSSRLTQILLGVLS
jgi:hypothetical protein